MNNIAPERIRLARRLQRLSMDDLVRLMGARAVSKMTISKIERGLLKPSDQTLQAIADACKVPLTFFRMPKVTLSPMSFRYEKDMPSKQARQIEANIIRKIEDSFAKEKMAGPTPPFVNPLQGIKVSTYDDAETAAQQLRQHIVIGNHPLHSVYEVLQELGVMVIEVDVDATQLLGTSTIIDNVQPAVIINVRSCTTTERKRFTALHELAHLLLDLQPQPAEAFRNTREDVTLKCPTVERLCHRFAGAMLISPTSLRRRLSDQRTEVSLKELVSIRNMYGISIAATVHRAHDLAIIPDSTYNHLFDHHIKKNHMETGWGSYPIMETADRYELLEARIRDNMFGSHPSPPKTARHD